MKKITNINLNEQSSENQDPVSNSAPRRLPPSGSGSGSGGVTILSSGSGIFTTPATSTFDEPAYQWFVQGEVRWTATAMVQGEPGCWTIIPGTLQLHRDSVVDFDAPGHTTELGQATIVCEHVEANGVQLSATDNVISGSTTMIFVANVDNVRTYDQNKTVTVRFIVVADPETSVLEVEWSSVVVSVS